MFLIADSHPVHMQRTVAAWFERRKENIEFVALPTYAPELNATEYLNQDLKTNGMAGRDRQTGRN